MALSIFVKFGSRMPHNTVSKLGVFLCIAPYLVTSIQFIDDTKGLYNFAIRLLVQKGLKLKYLLLVPRTQSASISFWQNYKTAN